MTRRLRSLVGALPLLATAVVAVLPTSATAANPNQVFLTGEPTDALVGATPTSYTTFAISGTASAFHITAGTADTALDISLAMNAGAKLAVGTFDTIASAGAKPVLLITRGSTMCAAKSSGRLLVDQVTVNAAGHLTRLVARWQFRCNGAPAASFGGVTWNGTAAFHTRTISPNAANLGNQRIGWPGGTKAVTVTNTGPARLTVTKVTLTGTQATDFDLAFAQWIHGINRGILLPPGLDEQWLISMMHSDDDAMQYAHVFAEFVDELLA